MLFMLQFDGDCRGQPLIKNEEAMKTDLADVGLVISKHHSDITTTTIIPNLTDLQVRLCAPGNPNIAGDMHAMHDRMFFFMAEATLSRQVKLRRSGLSTASSMNMMFVLWESNLPWGSSLPCHPMRCLFPGGCFLQGSQEPAGIGVEWPSLALVALPTSSTTPQAPTHMLHQHLSISPIQIRDEKLRRSDTGLCQSIGLKMRL